MLAWKFHYGDVVGNICAVNCYPLDCITGMSGNVVLDSNGDREPDYWITDMDSTGTFVKIAEILNTDEGSRVRRIRL